MMPLPTELDKVVRTRFDELVKRSTQLREDVGQSKHLYDDERSSNSEFFALKNQFLSLLELLSPTKEYSRHISGNMAKWSVYHASELLGCITALKADYETGLLDRLSRVIEANVNADYLGQAERLLKEGKVAGQFSHVPAAVLTGAILEDALRRLCQRHTPVIKIEKANGEPKTMMTLIDDLKTATVYSELTASQLRAWAHIRNKAAHGEFTQFTSSDVEQMLLGVRNFLTQYL